jgi:hypothetical protein
VDVGENIFGAKRVGNLSRVRYILCSGVAVISASTGSANGRNFCVSVKYLSVTWYFAEIRLQLGQTTMSYGRFIPLI